MGHHRAEVAEAVENFVGQLERVCRTAIEHQAFGAADACLDRVELRTDVP